LGLLGHLTCLTLSDTYAYLKRGHDSTTVAVLMGSAASKVGTADPRVFKTISLYMPALLPAPHADVDISPAVQAAGLIGLGLLYCSSGHRLMAEFLLTEMGRNPPSDRCEGREAIVTAAAWSLGMVLLGKGSADTASAKNAPSTPGPSRATGGGAALKGGTEALRSLQDLRVESRLLQFIEGAKRPAESTLFPSPPTTDVSSRSSRMLTGTEINTNVTAPGATIALGLIFVRSNNAEILNRLAIPATSAALEAMWSDLLFYRATACCLVKWDTVVPSAEWIQAQLPDVIVKAVFPQDALAKAAKDPKLLYQQGRRLDTRTALNHYLCAVSGYCFGIGLVFAGTSDATAKKTLLAQLKLLQRYVAMCQKHCVRIFSYY
jgi:anaphase-promoting complex subunit 1